MRTEALLSLGALLLAVSAGLEAQQTDPGRKGGSGLVDCDIPFAQLRTRSPSCTKLPPGAGTRCEAWSPPQFPEVVAVKIRSRSELCSGTVIAAGWVLTAAHCFVGDAAATEDITVAPQDANDITVTSEYALALPEAQRTRPAKRALVFGQYSGGPTYADDLALVELESQYPPSAVQPAILAPVGSFLAESTIAGYGYSNAGGGEIEELELTWPRPLARSGGDLQFAPTDGSAFCQGDSGGPVFAGRYRGCTPSDAAGEPRPRLIEGVITYNVINSPSSTNDPDAGSRAQRCRAASLNVTQSITVAERRAWICRITANLAGGC